MQNHSIFHSDGLESDKIDRLIVLPFMKSVEIAVKSIRVRFFDP